MKNKTPPLFLSRVGLASTRLLVSLGILLLLLIGCAIWFISSPVKSSQLSNSSPATNSKTPSHVSDTLSPNFPTIPAENPTKLSIPEPTPRETPSQSEAEKERILEQVREAAVTYNPASLPIIATHLNSPDPDVRLEAMNAVVTLGDAAGAPLLRAQVAKESDEARKSELLRLANWLELPPANITFSKKKPRSSPTPAQEKGSVINY